MKVTVIDAKTGKEKSMAPRFAKILTRMGRATYLTRDMEPATPAEKSPEKVEKAEPEVAKKALAANADDKKRTYQRRDLKAKD